MCHVFWNIKNENVFLIFFSQKVFIPICICASILILKLCVVYLPYLIRRKAFYGKGGQMDLVKQRKDGIFNRTDVGVILPQSITR